MKAEKIDGLRERGRRRRESKEIHSEMVGVMSGEETTVRLEPMS